LRFGGLTFAVARVVIGKPSWTTKEAAMLAQRWLELWDTIRHGEARVPARVAIPADHVIWGPELSNAVRAIAFTADEIDNELKAKFGGRLASEV
jgi:hypothetical protein